MSINSIQDAIKALAQSLNVATIFPASLFVLTNLYLIIPWLWPDKVDATSLQTITFTISITLILSYTLYAFNFPLIRLLEGYKLKDTKFIKDLKKGEEDRFNVLIKEITREENNLDFPPIEMENPKLMGLKYHFDRRFPSDPKKLLATPLGNTIAAFEDYPRTRYGMDSIALWPRLVPILKEKEFLDFVTQEKAVFDFLLNMFVVAIVLGLELFYLTSFWGYWITSLVIALLTAGVVTIFYEGMIIAARQWGQVVRVAFDLHRYDLYQRLGLNPKLAKTFDAEIQQWQRVSQFLLYPRKAPSDDFISQFEAERKAVKVD